MPIERMVRTALLLLACLAGPAQAAAERSVEEALRLLEARGQRFIFSSDLVRADMRTGVDLSAGTPAEAAARVLAPHGLALRPGPGGALVVVRAARVSPPARDDPAPDADAPLALDRVDVSASAYRLMVEHGVSGEFLSRDDVEHLPHLGNDPFRALDSVPGITGGDFGAAFNVRGGALDETLVVLDGMPLYEPFHMKNIQNALSIIDARAVAGLEFLTGGYPAEYGDRMSGVLDITTLRPRRDARDELGVSFVTAHALVQGGLGEGDWLLSARRGYLDIILDFLDPGGVLSPQYADGYFKSVHAVGTASTLSLHLLGAFDTDEFEDEDGDEALRGSYGSGYAWLGLHTDWNERLRSSTVLHGSYVTNARRGFFSKDLNTADVDEERALRAVGLRSDWSFDVTDDSLLRFGFDLRDLAADYDYASTQVIANPLLTGGGPPRVTVRDFDLAPEGRQYGFWLADRVRFGGSLVAEIGLRWDRQTWIAEPDATQVSPRVNLRWQLGRGVLKAGWGRFHQAQGLNELQLADGETAFHAPEEAEHRVIAWQSPLGRRTSLRLEAYDKDYRVVRPRYENLFDAVQLFPEMEPDRVRVAPDSARARGIEVTLRREVGTDSRIWLAFTDSSVTDRIAGRDVPRSWDQPQAINAGFETGRDGPWTFNLTMQWHTGWPTTDLQVVDAPAPGGGTVPVFVTGPRNGERFDDFMVINLRLSRRVELDASRLVWYLEVYNLLNSENPCCVDGFDFERRPSGSWRVFRDEDDWLPFLPSFGVRWEF